MRQTILNAASALVLCASLGGAAVVHAQAASTPAAIAPTAEPTSNQDPWEPANRKFYKFSQGVDRAAIRPASVFYHHAITHPVRDGVHNVLYNLGEPVTFVNDVLQVQPTKAAKTAVRFVTNSTIGLLGLFDVAGAGGIPIEPTGFGQTLGVYGAPQGPYIYIPVLGPATVRSVVGRAVDTVTDPFTWIKYNGRGWVQAGRVVAAGLDARVRYDGILKDVERTATDPYATIRSGYLQASNVKTKEGDAGVKALPDFGPEPGASPPSKPQ